MDNIISGFNFNNTYINLPAKFYNHTDLNLVNSPKLFILNDSLANELNLNIKYLKSIEGINILVGNKKIEHGSYISQAYAGHQFGYFNMLGDGRALLIGEHVNKELKKYDIQLKGSGKTTYSRGGDGKATLSSMMREYVMSESMHLLGVKTTRSLAVLKTGERIYRENIKDGAVLVRVASSHIRFATFQYAMAYGSVDDIKKLADYTIDRHFKSIKEDEHKYSNLLKEVVKLQAKLIAKWQSIGFIHGVMNTDNMSIVGETIDYGPCAFMNIYNPETVFSSIDREGRYSYKNQPIILEWNLCRFAETLIPIINKDREKSISIAQNIVSEFLSIYYRSWVKLMRSKLGIFNEEIEDKILIEELLNIMDFYKNDYTNTFVSLSMDKYNEDKMFNSERFKLWKIKWKDRLSRQKESIIDSRNLMMASNPSIIPRNHKIEKILRECESGNFSEIEKFLNLISNPYEYSEAQKEYMKLPKDIDKNYKTYCGT